MTITDESTVTPAEKKRAARDQKKARAEAFAPQTGTMFDPNDRLFHAWADGLVFDYGDYDSQKLHDMLRRDGKARSVEQILTLPLRAAPWKLESGKPEAGDYADSGETEQQDDQNDPALDLIKANLGPMLPRLIDQMTSAVIYRKAYFETKWTIDGGKAVYERIEWRPPTSCEAGFDVDTAQPMGFRQRVVPFWGRPAARINTTNGTTNSMPGYKVIPPGRAFIYTHGAYRDPIHGTSDMDCAYWAYETRQKILFLLFQFLENQSLPKTVVFGDSDPEIDELAEDFADLRSSGVLGVKRPSEPTAKTFEVLESSGLGHSQFLEAIRYLENQMTASVLAGFTDLTSANSGNSGSYALSADQSEFFLSARQAVADEMADAIREGVFRPLVAFNFGPDHPVPCIKIGPLAEKDVERSLTLLTAVISAQNLNIPREVVDQLLTHTAPYLGLDPDKVTEALDADKKLRDAQQKAQDAQQAQQQGMAAQAHEVNMQVAQARAQGTPTPPNQNPVPTAGAPKVGAGQLGQLINAEIAKRKAG